MFNKFIRTSKTSLVKHWQIIVISVAIIVPFARLFSPLSIFVTPDYGRSDSWHFSIANKYYLSQELKNNRIPIWNPHIGSGYPTLGEGQTSFFFLPNLILFKLLPFTLAYNTTLVTTFLIASFGTYFFCRSISLKKWPSVYAALIFPLSGFFWVHVQHINLLQTASILPWLFWASNEFFKKGLLLFPIVLSSLISLQIFAGFPQITLYSLVALSIYWVLKTFQERRQKLKIALIFTCVLVSSIAISSIQWAPTYELLKNSTRVSNPRNVLVEFPYGLKNLLLFFDPFILGSPKDASYPEWQPGEWGIYWENLAYIGIIPLSLAIALILASLFKKKYRKPTILIFATLVTVSLLLSLGLESPLHPIFSFVPFSIFRVPSRFLVIVAFSLTILSAIYLNKLRKNLLLTAIIAISIFDLYTKFASYNPTQSASEYFKDPQTALWLKQNNATRIFSIGQFLPWSNFFLSEGWQNTNYYFHARSSLDQNSNLNFAIDNISAYESLLPKRLNAKIRLISSGVKLESGKGVINKKSAQLLAASNVSHIITPNEIEGEYFSKVLETPNVENTTFKIYQATLNPQRVTMVKNYEVAKTITQITESISRYDFNPIEKIVIEKEPGFNNFDLESYSFKIVKETPTNVGIEVKNRGAGFLVLNDSFYPGWKAYDNDKEVEIFAANINSRAIYLNEGEHKIEFVYKSKILTFSLVISLVSIATIGLVSAKLRKKVAF